MEFIDILKILEEARTEVGYEFMRKETVFECATQIFINERSVNARNESNE